MIVVALFPLMSSFLLVNFFERLARREIDSYIKKLCSLYTVLYSNEVTSNF